MMGILTINSDRQFPDYNFDVVVTTILLIIIGVSAYLIFTTDYHNKNQISLYFKEQAFAVFSGIYFLMETRVIKLFVDVDPLYFYLHYISFFFFISGTAAIIESGTNSGFLTLLKRIKPYFLIFIATIAVLDFSSVIQEDIMLGLGVWIVLIFCIPMGIVLIKMNSSGLYNPHIISVGFSVLILFVFMDLWIALHIIGTEYREIIPWGYLFLIFSFIWVLVYKHKSDRRTYECMLKESRERFQRLIEDAPMPIFHIDMGRLNGFLKQANQKALDLFGYEKEELDSMCINEFFSTIIKEKKKNNLAVRLKKRLESNETFIIEEKGVKKNGTSFPVKIIVKMERFFGKYEVILIIEDLTFKNALRGEEEAVIQERRRIAMEIHDGPAQNLASMIMKADIWKYLLKTSPEKMLDEVDTFQKLIGKSIKEIRGCIYSLRPVDLENYGFHEGLIRLINNFEKNFNIGMNFEYTGLNLIPRNLESVIYRIIQEGLNNIAKHAGAKTVTIRLKICNEENISLKIEDNGKGFIPDEMNNYFINGHLGLKQIQERVQKEAGDFHVQSSPGKGTTLFITLPLQ